MSIIPVVFSQRNLSSLSGTRDPSRSGGTSTGCPAPIFPVLVYFLNKFLVCHIFECNFLFFLFFVLAN